MDNIYLEILVYFKDYFNSLLSSVYTVFGMEDNNVENSRTMALKDVYESRYEKRKFPLFYNRMDSIEMLRKFFPINKKWVKKRGDLPYPLPDSFRSWYEDMTNLYYQYDVAFFYKSLVWTALVFIIVYMLLKINKYANIYYFEHATYFFRSVNWYLSDLFLMVNGPLIVVFNIIFFIFLMWCMLALWFQILFFELEALELYIYHFHVRFCLSPKWGAGYFRYGTLEYRDTYTYLRPGKKLHSTLLYKPYLMRCA